MLLGKPLVSICLNIWKWKETDRTKANLSNILYKYTHHETLCYTHVNYFLLFIYLLYIFNPFSFLFICLLWIPSKDHHRHIPLHFQQIFNYKIHYLIQQTLVDINDAFRLGRKIGLTALSMSRNNLFIHA